MCQDSKESDSGSSAERRLALWSEVLTIRDARNRLVRQDDARRLTATCSWPRCIIGGGVCEKVPNRTKDDESLDPVDDKEVRGKWLATTGRWMSNEIAQERK